MPEFLSVFLPGFVSVFLLGFQSRLVNTGNYVGAAICSFTISIFQASLWSHLMRSSDATSVLAYGLAGATAITSALYCHQRFFGKSLIDKPFQKRARV